MTQGHQGRRLQVTTKNVLGSHPRIFTRDELMKLAEETPNGMASLWSEFAAHLPSFQERWDAYMTRDLLHDTLLHGKGNDQAVLPWVHKCHQFLLH